MKPWHYARAGQQHGPVAEDELRRALASGELALTDFVWKEGMPEWTPAGQIAELVPEGAPRMPPPLPAQAMAYYAPPPPGAPGFVQPDVDPALKWIVPVGRTGSSIAAGYLGLFSAFCGLLAPIAIIVSIVAIKDLRKNPSKSGMGRAITGLVLGSLFGLAWLILIGMQLARNGRF